MLGVLRGYNFLYFSLLSLFVSFLPVYLAEIGVSAGQIGAMLGTGALIGIVSQPFWGYQSDRHRTVKKVILLIPGLSVLIGTTLFSIRQPTALFVLVGLLYFFYVPSDPLTESLNYRLSERFGVSFGSVRMFGAIGFASTSLAVGWLADWFGIGALAWLFLGLGGATLLLCMTLPDVAAKSHSFSVRDFLKFLQNRRTLLFLVLVLITALPHRMNDIFLGVYLHDLGASTTLIGVAWFVAAVSETAFFAWSGRLLRNGNEGTWIAAAGVLYTLRFLLCALFPTAWAVTVLQLLQGVTFVVFYTASLQYLNRTVPEEWQATGTTLVAILFFGVSSMLGSWIGGFVFDWWGGTSLYLMMAALSFVAFVYAVVCRKQISS